MVSIEGCYVLLYPLKRKALVEDTGVLGTEWDLRGIREPKDLQIVSGTPSMEEIYTVGSIIDTYNKNILGYGKITTVEVLITPRAKLQVACRISELSLCLERRHLTP